MGVRSDGSLCFQLHLAKVFVIAQVCLRDELSVLDSLKLPLWGQHMVTFFFSVLGLELRTQAC
jgi:hypothetical protein